MRQKACKWQLQTHPYPPFIPEEAEILLVGSAPPYRFCTSDKASLRKQDFDYYYGSSSNLFWEILFRVFEPENLPALNELRQADKPEIIAREGLVASLQSFLSRHKLGLGDILYRFMRCGQSAADYQLQVLEYQDIVPWLIRNRSLKAICCTSKNRVFYWLWEYLELQESAGLIESDKIREGFFIKKQTEIQAFSINHYNPNPHPGPDPGSPLIAGDSCFRRNEETGSFQKKTEPLEECYIPVKILPSPSARGIMRFANKAEYLQERTTAYREILLPFFS